MGHNDHIDEQLSELIDEAVVEDFLQEFEEDGKTRTAAYGVAQAMIHGENLTPKQQAIYDRVVVPALEKLGAMHETNRILISNPD